MQLHVAWRSTSHTRLETAQLPGAGRAWILRRAQHVVGMSGLGPTGVTCPGKAVRGAWTSP